MEQRRPRFREKRRRDETVAALICLLPAAVILLVFSVIPILVSAFLSLVDWRGAGSPRTFVGLAQYGELFRTPEFWNSVKVTVLYAAGVTVFGLVAGLAVALGLSGRVRGRAVWRSVYFVPAVTSTVAAGIVWTYLFDPSGGLINRWLGVIGVSGPAWLTDPSWALPAVIAVGVWKRLGFNMLIYLAGLQSVPDQYYEAVAVDGAGPWAKFRFITWPLLSPTTWLLTIMSMIDSFQVFDQVFVMTSGGPMGATEVLGLYLYRQGFNLFHLGFASAIGWVIFVFVFVATVIQWRVSGMGGERVYVASRG